MDETLKALKARYLAAAHAVQSGIVLDLEQRPESGSPKHLRVGNDMRAADAAGLAKLLIAKGVFTEAEYYAAMAEAAEQEQARWEATLSARHGARIKLG